MENRKPKKAETKKAVAAKTAEAPSKTKVKKKKKKQAKSNRQLLLLAAELSLTMDQAAISEALHRAGFMSGGKKLKDVSAYVQEAREWLIKDGIKEYRRRVRREPSEQEKKLKASFPEFLDVRVVPGGDDFTPSVYPILLRQYGRAAAEYLDDYADFEERNGQEVHIALSGGNSILDMVEALPDRRRQNVHFYAAAIIGRGAKNLTAHPGPETTATLAWARSGRLAGHLYCGTASPCYMKPGQLDGYTLEERHAWGFKNIPEQVAKIGASPAIEQTLKVMSKNINMAIAGCGVVRVSPTAKPEHSEKISVLSLLEPYGLSRELLHQNGKGAIGDFSYSFFDEDGKDRLDKWQFFLTAGHGSDHPGIDFYRKLVSDKRPVVVMAGYAKWISLLPAIHTKMFNVLVTDAFTANSLIAWRKAHPVKA